MNNPCDHCGLCCRKLIIEIEHVDVVREPLLLPVVTLLDGGGDVEYDDEWEKEYRLAPQAPGKHACPMLDSCNRCTIYATRPNTCVMFEAGGDHCNELRMTRDEPLPPINCDGSTLPLCDLCKGKGYLAMLSDTVRECSECDGKGYVRG